MTVDRSTGALEHRIFRELPQLIRAGDLLVVNRSRVFPARLVGRRRHGGEAEVLLLRQTAPRTWHALLRPGRRLRPGDEIRCDAGLTVTVLGGPLAEDGRREIRLDAPAVLRLRPGDEIRCDAGLTVTVLGGPLAEDGRREIRLDAPGDPDALLETAGRIPLPPYIERAPTDSDRDRYQTVYAREPGSVAAPTAGLHFTPSLIAAVQGAGAELAELFLHVGPGTFRPVKVDDIRDHRVAAEPFDIPPAAAEAIARTRARSGRVIAVGTTVVRALESAASAPGIVAAGPGETGLVVVPGFEFRVVDALITNFHLPRSSLLLLVCAFAGQARTLAAYREAVSREYRFYSYGDAMFIYGTPPRP